MAPTSLATMRRNHMMLRTMPLASGGGGRKQRRQLLTCQSAAAHSDNLDAASAAMLLSQSGPCSAQVFLMLPVCPELILEPAHFRVLLLRRLRLPLPFVPARCRRGREQDALGDHRSACPQSGVLRARGGPLERAAARICREAGAVVAMHTLVRDLNVGSVPGDDRRIEVIANGLPLWGGMQLAVDTTLVSALSSTGAPRRYQNRAEGAALRQARRAKERTYPELLRPDSRCRQVVLALEVGGRFSPETVHFVQRLARARARSVPPRVRGAVSAAFARRWSSFLVAGASRAYAASLLALPAHSAAGVDGPPPLVSDVLADGGEPFVAR